MCQPTNGCFSHLHPCRVSYASSQSDLLLLRVHLLQALRCISLPLGLQLVRLCPRRLQHLCLRVRGVLTARESSHTEEQIQNDGLTAAPVQRGRKQTHVGISAQTPRDGMFSPTCLLVPVLCRNFDLLFFFSSVCSMACCFSNECCRETIHNKNKQMDR